VNPPDSRGTGLDSKSGGGTELVRIPEPYLPDSREPHQTCLVVALDLSSLLDLSGLGPASRGFMPDSRVVH
jgi:hypothetical protein